MSSTNPWIEAAFTQLLGVVTVELVWGGGALWVWESQVFMSLSIQPWMGAALTQLLGGDRRYLVVYGGARGALQQRGCMIRFGWGNWVWLRRFGVGHALDARAVIMDVAYIDDPCSKRLGVHVCVCVCVQHVSVVHRGGGG